MHISFASVLAATVFACAAAQAAEPPTTSSPTATAPGTASTSTIAEPTAESSLRAGTLKLIQGRVRVERDGAAARMAQPGGFVMPHERLVTDASSGASLVLRDGTTVVLGPVASLDLKDFSFDSTTNQGSVWVALLRGSMRMITGLVGKTQPERLRVQARTVTIGVRGTDFIVEVDEP